MTSARIEQLWVPDTVDGPDAGDFLAAVEVGRRVREQTWGNDDLAFTAEDMLRTVRDPYERHVVLVARLGDSIVGRAGVAMPMADDTELAEVIVEVLPSVRGRGVGRELLRAAEEYAAAELRRQILVETHHGAATLPGDDSGIPAASGVGELPAASREAAFARAAGYRLEHVESFSAVSLPLTEPSLRRVGDVAETEDEYWLHYWTNRCPDRWVADIADIEARLGADDSEAETDVGPWNVQRVRQTEQLASEQGRRTLVCAVEHLPSGRLAGYTSVTVLAHRGDIAFQDDTLLLPEHRGRRLGLWVRGENLRRLAGEGAYPRRIYIWNAAENDYMRDVNELLGFATAGYTGQWRKSL